MIISLLIFYGCNQKNNCLNGIKAKYVNQTELDGCGWMILLKNKQKLSPINLYEFEKKT